MMEEGTGYHFKERDPFSKSAPGAVAHLGLVPRSFSDALQREYRLFGCAVIVAQKGENIICIGTDHSNAAESALQGEDTPFILEQHYRLTRGLQREGAVTV
jgi:hypothetical protein